MYETPVHPCAADQLRARITKLPEVLRENVAHLLSECGERIAPIILGEIEANLRCRGADISASVNLVREYLLIYSRSTLSHTDQGHDDGFVRRGAENAFLESIWIVPPRD